MAEWFRIVDGRYAAPLDELDRPMGEGQTYVTLYRYRVLKETPCGAWLEDGCCINGRRFVLRDARKRYACPTLDEAVASFRARKKQQLRILTNRVRRVHEALGLLPSITRTAEGA